MGFRLADNKKMFLNITSKDINGKYDRRCGAGHNSAFFDRNNEVIYLHTHKNASKTIRKMMGVFHKHAECHCLFTDEATAGYKLFWVVRDPIERFVASFCEIWHIDGYGRPNEFIVRDTEVLKKTRHTINGSFDKFVKKVEKYYFDQHVYPQILTLAHKNIEIEDVDKIILFDNLQEEIATFANENNIKNWDTEALQIKKGESDISLKKYLSDRIEKTAALQERIISLYEEDMEIYQQLVKLRGQ